MIYVPALYRTPSKRDVFIERRSSSHLRKTKPKCKRPSTHINSWVINSFASMTRRQLIYYASARKGLIVDIQEVFIVYCDWLMKISELFLCDFFLLSLATVNWWVHYTYVGDLVCTILIISWLYCLYSSNRWDTVE
jgi:hypothetical protein